jgi:prepilin-type N-terminal cleavage/methylation domain-containing protein
MLMAKRKPLKSEGGFTLLELLIATSVFSIVLLIVTTGIIRLGQSYYKGIIQSRTQETTRAMATDISRAFQFADGTKVSGDGANQFCIGDTRYTYFINQPVRDGAEGLRSERIEPNDACNDPSAGSDRKEMMGNNMRLLKFDVNPADSQSKTWRIEMGVAYGDNDLLSHYTNDEAPQGWDGNDVNSPAVRNAVCKSGIPGGSFCATSQLDILVKKRLN